MLPRNELEDKLLNFGPAAWEYLETVSKQTSETENLSCKFHAARLIQDFIDLHYKARWESHMTKNEISLEEGGVILAQSMGRDFVTMEAIDESFSQIIDAVRGKLFPAATKTQIFEAYNSTFFGEFGFGGMDSEGYLPSNSFIDQVLYSKKGIQITLCLVYASIGRRLGLKIQMIGMPKHFVVRYDEPGPYEGFYVDVFTGGQIFNRTQLENRYPFAKLLTDYPASEVYVRIYRNLIEEYNGGGQIGLMLRALNHSITISPQQEEIAYRLMIQSNYKARIKEAFQDFQTLVKLGLRKPASDTLEQNLLTAKTHFEHEHLTVTPKKTRPMMVDIGQLVVHSSLNTRGVVTGWEDDGQIKVFWDESSGEDLVACSDLRLALNDECQPLNSLHLGNFFSTFRDKRYQPLSFLRLEYPMSSIVVSQEYLQPMQLTTTTQQQQEEEEEPLLGDPPSKFGMEKTLVLDQELSDTQSLES